MRGIRRVGAAALSAALLIPSALAKLEIKSARATQTDINGSDKSYTIKDGSWTEPVTLAPSSTFKLSFTVTDGSAGVVPQQAYLHLRDVDSPSSESVTLALGVKSSGKATYYMDTAKVPSALAKTSGLLDATLILSRGEDTYKSHLGSLVLPASALADKEKSGEGIVFGQKPELEHTFRPDEKEIPLIKATLGSFAVLAPWMTLLALVGAIWPSIQVKTPPAVMYAWLACLVALEALILRYWIGLRLYQLLPPFIGLGAVTAYMGTVALRASRVRRLKAGGAP